MLSAAVLIVKTGNSYGCEVATITLKNGELTLSRLDLVAVIRSAVFTRATTETTTSNIPNVNLADKRDRCTIPSFSVGQRNQIRHF